MNSRKLRRAALIGLVILPALASGLFRSSANNEVGRGAPARAAAQTQLSLKTSSAAQPDAAAVAEQHVRARLAALGLTESDVNEWKVSDRYETKHNGVTHVYFQQRLGGIEVINGILNVNVARDGRVLSVGNRFVPNLAAAANARAPQLTAEQAVRAAAAHLGLNTAAPLGVTQLVGGATQEVVFVSAALSRKPIRARLQYLPVGRGARLVWDVQIQPDSNNYWHVEVDAVTGEVLRKFNLVERDSYKVYAWPAESPNHVRGLPLPPADGRAVVTQAAANSTASPFGWHDTNGVAGADTTDTTGNNVATQTDETNDDIYNPLLGEVRPSSPTRDFVFPVDLTQEPTTYRPAVVTNLFYWNNVIHDILYLYGFDEASGNFQENNYGRGGQGGDRVEADAQDGSGKNNANFLTLPEGTPGSRMQMFLWAGEPVLRVNSPDSIDGDYRAAAAAFGAPLDANGVTGDIQHANAPGPNPGPQGERPEHGCFPAPGTMTGKIALIKRGGCEFGQKVVSAEQSGAIAAVIYNHEAGGDDLVFMGPGNAGAAATIPSVFIGHTHGTLLRDTDAATNVNVTMKKASVDRDSDLDNGVIIHEYGHGVSNRLTGGPTNVVCLESLEQGGEGWSDWFALTLTARAGDRATDARGIGTYVTFQDPPEFGGGIRLYPYSTDPSVNPQTYESIDDPEVTVPHGVGSIWAEMLWEVYWNMVDGVPELNLPGRGFRQNLYDKTAPLAGNQLAIQLVMDGLKMQPCNPTFVEQRDAILAADQADNGGAFQCHIWEGFAKRGLGVNAQDGGKFPLDDRSAVVEDFTLPAQCTLSALTNFAAAANGATAAASSTYPNDSYPAASAIDGDRTGSSWGSGGGWADGTRDVWPDWLEVSFSGQKSINQIRVYTLQDGHAGAPEPTLATPATLYGLIDYDVEYWNGSSWVTLPNGQVRGNALAVGVLVFNEVTTSKIRVRALNGRNHYSRVVEVEAFGLNNP